jgi:thioredoxin domain-containing protein 5
VNVAKVDVTANSELGKRFGIRGFPTVLLFSHGKYHKFAGQRTQETLVSFARGDFKKVDGTAVPTPASLTDYLLGHVEALRRDFISLAATKKNVLLVTFSGGMLIGLLLGCMCGCCTSRGGKKAATPKPKKE